jgi:RNA polymerase sigma-70 factor (ECF subfamily)
MADGRDDEREEAALIGRVVALDDHVAFTVLVRRHQSAVRRFLRRLTGADWSLADDLAQETFLKAYRHISTFRGRGRFLSWLFRIAYQEFVTVRRRQPTRLPEAVDEDLSAGEGVESRYAGALTVDRLVDRLRPDERAALLLHYRHDLTHEEVAATLDLPLGTVKSLIRRARFKLRELLVPPDPVRRP